MLQIYEDMAGAVAVIRIAGEPQDEGDVSRILRLVEARLRLGVRLFILNLGNCPGLASEHALIELVRINAAVRTEKGRIHLCEVPEGLLQKMQDHRVFRTFEIDRMENPVFAPVRKHNQASRLRA